LSLYYSTKKKKKMKREFTGFKAALSAMIILAFLAMPFTLDAQAGKANFSGTWSLNVDKSDMGPARQGQGQGQGQPPQGQGQRPGGFGGGRDFVAKQDANALTVERSFGEQTMATKYTLDGKETVNSTGRGESKSVATWSADGKTLKIVTTRSFERDGQTTEMKTTEEWTLTSPSVLTIKTTRASQQGDRVTTAVYDKK